MIKCVHCEREVMPIKPRLSLFWLFLWLLVGIFPGIIYYVYNRSKSADKCPACGKNAYK